MRLVKYADRDAWLRARKLVIGGSDAGAIMGLSEYRTPLMVYRDKVDGTHREMTDAALWGIRAEPMVREAFAEEQKDKLTVRYDGANAIAHHDTIDWLAMSPDGFVTEAGQDGVLQVKTHGDPWVSIPMEYLAQVQHEMAATDLRFCYLVSFSFYRRKMEHWRIERDDAFIKTMLSAEEQFVRRVRECRPPPSLDARDTEDAVALLKRAVPGKEVQLGSEVVDLTKKLLVVKAEKAAKEEQQKSLESRIKLALGDAEYGVAGQYRWSWKNQEHKEHTVKAHTRRVLRLAGGDE